jgi:hypothetical protein
MARGGRLFSPSVIRTIAPSGKLTFDFGSCRVSIRHEEPCTLKKSEDRHGHGRDTLYALAIRMKRQPEDNWPTHGSRVCTRSSSIALTKMFVHVVADNLLRQKEPYQNSDFGSLGL